jgi:hypothetical protein
VLGCSLGPRRKRSVQKIEWADLPESRLTQLPGKASFTDSMALCSPTHKSGVFKLLWQEKFLGVTVLVRRKWSCSSRLLANRPKLLWQGKGACRAASPDKRGYRRSGFFAFRIVSLLSKYRYTRPCVFSPEILRLAPSCFGRRGVSFLKTGGVRRKWPRCLGDLGSRSLVPANGDCPGFEVRRFPRVWAGSFQDRPELRSTPKDHPQTLRNGHSYSHSIETTDGMN